MDAHICASKREEEGQESVTVVGLRGFQFALCSTLSAVNFGIIKSKKQKTPKSRSAWFLLSTEFLKRGNVDNLKETTGYNIVHTSHVGGEVLRAGRGREGSKRGVRAGGFGGDQHSPDRPRNRSIPAPLRSLRFPSLEHFWQSSGWKLESRYS